ncbi:DUF4247 domain-containing protein [Paenibacillus sp. J2TS4]|uniref:DUF4247 domain-containing protein n=1 Tax=Paenibacillus sp. J2TS4 TaxID=2807194 RepID=UPI001B1D8E17|nr:DUF4247 domain-containing protein [Paenibacillus sp. J2TS4]GIP33886.1 hypothetical protein J2TS4_30960 [Paenibacillus sp. J2TS4]
MKRWVSFIAAFLSLTLVLGCSSAGSYVKDHFPLSDVIGKGKDTSKIYFAEGQDVPTTAKELSKQEKPQEISEENDEQMFLLYKDKLINLQKDPENEENTIIEISSSEYVRKNYDSSFLEGFLTAALLNSWFGGWEKGGDSPGQYRGYNPASVPPKSAGDPSTSSGTSPPKSNDSPTTSDRTGSFSSKASKEDKGKQSTVAPAPSAKPKSSGIFSTKSSSESKESRKNDGSTPSVKKPSKPKTSKRIGSFSRRR